MAGTRHNAQRLQPGDVVCAQFQLGLGSWIGRHGGPERLLQAGHTFAGENAPVEETECSPAFLSFEVVSCPISVISGRAVAFGQRPEARQPTGNGRTEALLAGNGTDLSGVKTEMVGTLLSWMQDQEAEGIIFIGPAGTAKSATAKAAGKEEAYFIGLESGGAGRNRTRSRY